MSRFRLIEEPNESLMDLLFFRRREFPKAALQWDAQLSKYAERLCAEGDAAIGAVSKRLKEQGERSA